MPDRHATAKHLHLCTTYGWRVIIPCSNSHRSDLQPVQNLKVTTNELVGYIASLLPHKSCQFRDEVVLQDTSCTQLTHVSDSSCSQIRNFVLTFMMLHAHSQGPLRFQYDHCCIVILSSYVTLLLLAFRQLWKDYGGPCVAGQLHAHLQCHHGRVGCAESASIMCCRCGQEHEPVWFASGDAQQLWVGQPRPQWGGKYPKALLTLSTG